MQEKVFYYGLFGLGLIIATLLRGLIIWILVPLEALVWTFGCYWFLKQRVGLGRFLGWMDANLWVLLLGISFATVDGEQLKEIPYRDIQTVTHRLGGMGLTNFWRDQ